MDDLSDFDVLVRSPGVRPDRLPPSVPTTSVIREFLHRCPVPVIGVTGTQGKGTTCTALASIIRATGRRAFVGGNIGTPPLEFLPQLEPGDIVVLELSNLQLIDATKSPDVAVVLAITPDHLNWHRDLDEYLAAKESITRYQSPDDVVVYDTNSAPAARIAGMSSGRKVGVGESAGIHVSQGGIWRGQTELIHKGGIHLRGTHNASNFAFAAAIEAIADITLDEIRCGIDNVAPLPHRLCPVGTVAGVTYVNDSLSTTPETTRAAIAAYEEPKILILGGSSKGLDYSVLARELTKVEVRRALDSAGYANYEVTDEDLASVVAKASKTARSGDVVLLSPACASFDRYRNYADRGDQFIAAV